MKRFVAAAMRWLSSERAISAGLVALSLMVIVGWGLYLRWPAADVNIMRNEDVAGITYNADLIAAGQRPLVDNLEPKAPGAFFLTWAIFKVWGRSVRVHERFGIFWGLLAAVGMFVGGWALFGRISAGFVAGLLFTFGAPITDSLTVNYNSWMITGYVWTTALFVIGLRRGKLGWLAAAGATMVWTALLKRQGGVVMPLFVALIALGPHLPLPRGWVGIKRSSGLLAYVGGMALGYLPFVMFYLVTAGVSGAVVATKHFVFSATGWKYVGGQVDWNGKLDRIEDGLLGFWEFMALPTLLMLMTLVSVPLRRQRAPTAVGVLLAGHMVLSVVGLALGFRFYMGYYLQALPPAAWIAAHPDGPILRWFRRDEWPRQVWPALLRVGAVVLLLCGLLPAIVADAADLKKVRKYRERYNHYQHEAIKISAIVKDNSRRGDKIWVWGRWAWPVYFHANRLSCSRYYKVLSVVTTHLDNTWRRSTSMTRFNANSPWRVVGKDIVDCRPLFVVTANNESYRGWKPIEKMLREKYVQVPRFSARAFKVYVRKDHAEKMYEPYGKRKKPRTPPAKKKLP
ncbi:MAG: hypothetical protein KC503_15835 [Myxococcales bacterium]|nr:hypothetical protein [Myxococcales bacterium]